MPPQHPLQQLGVPQALHPRLHEQGDFTRHDPSPLQHRVLSLPGSPSRSMRKISPQSTVVRLVNLRSTPKDLLWKLFTHGCSQIALPPPTPVQAPPETSIASAGNIWAVFPSPSEARAALGLSCDLFTVAPALESEFAFLPATRRIASEPLSPQLRVNTQRASTQPPMIPESHFAGIHRPPQLRSESTAAQTDSAGGGAPTYTISSNPPNPKTSFRLGDWICSASNCSAHNFQRNTVCIACGRPRTGGACELSVDTALSPPFPLAAPSPRFAGMFNTAQGVSPVSPSAPTGPVTPGYPAHAASNTVATNVSHKPPPPQYPPLTPSGRALSVGGRVRNISRHPLSPCVMYWPDNEPLPEPCQIRPIETALMTYPPIINTGNKGAAEKQPGDWVCGKCNYHNWRRRKVCQTCYPYAEGNGDSISAAVQAERIALLANVLTTQFNALDLNGVPAQPERPQRDLASAPPQQLHFPNGRSRSMGNSRHGSPLLPPIAFSDQDKGLLPIYQTSGGHPERVPRELQPYGGGLMSDPRDSHNLLPSFLQDIIHSPSQSSSPTSSSSADLSYDGSSEDAHYILTPGTSSRSVMSAASNQRGHYNPGPRKSSSSSYSSLGRSSGSSIWKLDGEESKTYSTSSSTRTSPTSHHAQAASVRRDVNSNDHAAAASFADVESGVTPKGTSGFWQAASRYA
ncbi:hypothetical protein BD311DRAFT_717443 [Dichomitus squalens]|uniref:RanBP2-type domain-containing protein n=1 Tax=Dichomitus squalens TaxID=114155 RepID=A0A4Q9MW51_9APHY|nr:hypothetical protein BD311DRAFT_717443 [Dichomitus squalens]